MPPEGVVRLGSSLALEFLNSYLTTCQVGCSVRAWVLQIQPYTLSKSFLSRVLRNNLEKNARAG